MTTHWLPNGPVSGTWTPAPRWRARVGYVRMGRITSGRWRFGFEWDDDGLEIRAFAGSLYFGRVA